MKRKPLLLILLILMGGMTLALIGVATYLFLGGNMPLARKGSLQVYIQAVPKAAVGEETDMVITVRNETGEFISIDEIRLPRSLLDAAQIASILPGTLSHTDYADQTGYQIGFLMAPGDQREFEVKLVPEQVGDVLGDVEVLAEGGKWRAVTGFRMTFDQPMAKAATPLPTKLPSPTVRVTLTDTTVAPTASPTQTLVPYAAIVKITAQVKHSSYLRDVWSGSGTIISPNGLILTNAHMIDPGAMMYSDFYKVSITDDPAEPPVDMYFAKPVLIDKDLDLAVILITSDLKYKPVDNEGLDLAAIPLGDSSKLNLGDPLFIVGYPGIGGETITLTRGDVGGFTVFGQDTQPSYIKTSGSISGGTSGGAALDQFGRLVGIPTQLGYGQDEGNMVDCRVIADTNGDGKVNDRDVCVPVGGFINALRPINIALPMIEEAKKMISLGWSPDATTTPTPGAP